MDHTHLWHDNRQEALGERAGLVLAPWRLHAVRRGAARLVAVPRATFARGDPQIAKTWATFTRMSRTARTRSSEPPTIVMRRMSRRT